MKLEAICVPSGPTPMTDLSRVYAAMRYARHLAPEVPFRILGAGKDIGKAYRNFSAFNTGQISHEELVERQTGLDHHLGTYLLLKNSGRKVQIENKSTTTVENILYGFPQEGIFAVATDPWHYSKFEIIQERLKELQLIPENLRLYNIRAEDIGYYNSIEKMLSTAKTKYELFQLEKAIKQEKFSGKLSKN